MEVGQLRAFFKQSAVVRLMNADQAPYLLALFYRVFKEGKRIELEQEELLAALRDFQDDVEGDGVLVRPAEEYLAEWCGENCRFLRRFLANDSNTWMIQLQAETEEVLRFLEGVFSKQQGMISTGSRMQMIVESVKELVLYASGDVEAQKEQLRREQRRIEAKLAALDSSEEGELIEGNEVQERFHMIVSMLRDLTGDFRGVEQRFRDIVHGLRERERGASERTGDILGYVLDAEDELKKHPHGASFYAFVKFVLSTEQRDDFDEMVAELRSLESLQTSVGEMDSLQGMMPLLTDEATKILSTTQRLSVALRRLLDPRASEEHRRLSELVQDNLRGAAHLRLAAKSDQVSMEVEVSAAIDSPMTRDFWKPVSRFEPTKAHAADESEQLAWQKNALQEYAALRRLDWKSMEKRVKTLLKSKPKLSLQEVLGAEKLETGLVEVLGYMQLAHDGGHVVDDSSPETIVVMLDEGEKRIRIPRVTFVRNNRKG